MSAILNDIFRGLPIFRLVSLDSAVGIATRYWPGTVRGSNAGGGGEFSAPVQLLDDLNP